MPTPIAAAVSVPWKEQAYALLENRCGFDTSSERIDRVVLPWIDARAKDLGQLPSLYLRQLRESPPTTAEWRAFLHVLTVNETSFMRHREQLARWLVKAKARYDEVKRPLTIWSAGCSSGEEVYTLAILLAEAGIPAKLTGSDLDPEVIEMARAGNRYTWYKVRTMDEGQRQRFLAELPNQRWQVRRSAIAQQSVQFQTQNLVDDPALKCSEGWDFIFCRNVFIYFPTATVLKVAQGMHNELAPGGALWVGATDALHGLPEDGDRSAAVAKLASRPTSRPPALAAQPISIPVPPQKIQQVASDYGTVVHLLERGAPDLAYEHLRGYLRQHPNDAVARTTMGNFQVRAHQFAAALESYNQAGADGHLAAEVDYFRGVTHYKTGDLKKALECLEAAQAKNAQCWPAAFLAGIILRKQGRPLPAELAFRRALMGLRAHNDCFTSRAELINSVHNDPELAQAEAQRYLAPPPESP